MTNRINGRNTKGEGGSTLYGRLYRKPPRKKVSRTAIGKSIGQCVYFIRTPDGLIKIGHTSNISHRKGGLGAHWDDILVVFRGTLADESAMHARFAEHLHHGREWFNPAPSLIEFINAQRQLMGVGPIT